MSSLREFFRDVVDFEESKPPRREVARLQMPRPDAGEAPNGEAPDGEAPNGRTPPADALADALIRPQLEPGVGGKREVLEATDDLLLDFVARIVIVNKTDVALSKADDKLEKPSRYQVPPPVLVPAHQSVPFTVLGKRKVVGSVDLVPDGGLNEKWLLEYSLEPPGLVPSGITSGTHTINSTRFTSAVEENKANSELRFILNQKGTPPAPESFVSRVIVRNDTDLVLRK